VVAGAVQDSAFPELAMARDFWIKGLILKNFNAFLLSAQVLWNLPAASPVVETLWRRPEPTLGKRTRGSS
jgi:hypothetical protein